MRGGNRAPMRLRVLATVGLLGSSLVACGGGAPDPTGADALANATFLSTGNSDGAVTLMAGAFDFPPGGEVDRVELIQSAQGDFDGDDDLDAAVVLAEYRGRQELYRLHAVIADGKGAEDVAERLIGDRVIVEGLRVVDGIVEVDLLIREAGSSVETEPSVPITSMYALTGRGLVPINPPTIREGSPRAMGAGTEADLESHEWVLQSIEMGDWSQSMDALERRPSLRFSSELGTASAGSGRVSGFAGCNQVFGGYSNQEDGALKVTALGATRRMCDEALSEIEQRFIASLTASQSHEIQDDQLVIEFNGGVMRFTAGSELEPPVLPTGTSPRDERGGVETRDGERVRGRQT